MISVLGSTECTPYSDGKKTRVRNLRSGLLTARRASPQLNTSHFPFLCPLNKYFSGSASPRSFSPSHGVSPFHLHLGTSAFLAVRRLVCRGPSILAGPHATYARSVYVRTHYFCFFKSSLSLSSLTRKGFYPRRPSGQAVGTGAYPFPPRYVPLFLVAHWVQHARRSPSNAVNSRSRAFR